MCGRIVRGNDDDYYIHEVAPSATRQLTMTHQGYNIPPQQPVLSLLISDGEPAWRYVHWGLLPSWAKEPTDRSYANARAETVAEKRTFASSFKGRRCIVPVDGYYEWQVQETGPKQPYYITDPSGAPLLLAGIWNTWRDTFDSAAVLTTAPIPALEHIHHRMPVLIEHGRIDEWLGGGEPAAQAMALADYEGTLTAIPVSRAVNNPRHDRADLIAPIMQ